MSADGKRAVMRVEAAEEVPVADLLARVARFHEQGFRFVTATCLDRGENLEILYNFDKDLELHHLRTTVAKTAAVPSLTPIYLCAFLVENEMSELFGLKVEGMAIDFGGGLLLAVDAPRAPMLKSAPAVAK
jgi:NADH:ubiquinone oxidoreductase subunit C